MRRALIAVAGAVVLAGCSSSGAVGAHRPPRTPSRSGISSTPRGASPGISSAGSRVVEPSSVISTAQIAPPGAGSGSGGHVVVVVEENHSSAEIIGNPDAPYLADLARSGASLTAMHAVTHPSEPNYLALFSGSTHGVTSDACPLRFGSPTIAGALSAAGLTFTGYAEGLPRAGSSACSAGQYARKHVPWTDFGLPTAVNQPLTAWPSDLARLPSVSFVIPDLDHDMHDGTVAQADSWLRRHLDSYARWAVAHGSLLVVTWDEDDRSESNTIPTFIVGAGVRPQQVSAHVSLYSLLRLLADRFGVQRPGAAATAPRIPLR